jgi:hypothetical protein
MGRLPSVIARRGEVTMTSRLLLTIGLLGLLAMPGALFAQSGVEAGWADIAPKLDGTIGATEWANGARVTLIPAPMITEPSVGDAKAGQSSTELMGQDVSPAEVSGWARFMNDEQDLYLAVSLDIEAPPGVPDRTQDMLQLWFEDEPPVGDGTWAASLCSENPDEGYFDSFYSVGDGTVDYDALGTLAEEGFCVYTQSPPGYWRAFGRGSANWEVRIDLSASALQAPPGDCFYLGVYVGSEEVFGEDQFVLGAGEWPEGLLFGEKPDILGEVCLAEPPVEPIEEAFVPEAGSLALLGSGLAGLGGYAALRWRPRGKE